MTERRVFTKTLNGLAKVGNHEVRVTTGNGHGSTNTKIRRYTTTQTNVGTAITYADSAANGATFTINEPGIYSISVSDTRAAADADMGISLNSAELTTSITTITAANRLMMVRTPAGTGAGEASIFAYLVAGDIVRAHTDGNLDSTDAATSIFSIRKVASV